MGLLSDRSQKRMLTSNMMQQAASLQGAPSAIDSARQAPRAPGNQPMTQPANEDELRISEQLLTNLSHSMTENMEGLAKELRSTPSEEVVEKIGTLAGNMLAPQMRFYDMSEQNKKEQDPNYPGRGVNINQMLKDYLTAAVEMMTETAVAVGAYKQPTDETKQQRDYSLMMMKAGEVVLGDRMQADPSVMQGLQQFGVKMMETNATGEELFGSGELY